ncbi:MAG: rplW [Chloroflexi bacterium]|jgi:large subunit ribosomal protein L23|nr:rplW [Chloroflexota bacterium]
MTTIYEVLRRPLVTEKSNYQNSKLNQFVFEVAPDATKNLVKDAIETLFEGVKVERVNVINVPARRTRRARSRRVMIRRAGYKKAIVTLTADSKTIPVFEGVR